MSPGLRVRWLRDEVTEETAEATNRIADAVEPDE
jgi:hypothetical protein